MTIFVSITRFQPRKSAFLAVAACLTSFSASAANYTYTTITVPGAFSTYAIGLADDGTLLGGYQNSESIYGFVYKDGKVRKLSVPNAVYTQPGGINKHGEIVGTYEMACPNCQNHGFIYAHGKYTSYDVPGAFDTQFLGVNSRGEIAGTTYAGSLEDQTGFTLSNDGHLTLITGATPPATLGFVAPISDRGVVIGNDAQGAFRTQKATVVPVTIAAAVLPPFLNAINGAGAITGTYIDNTDAILSFTLAGGKLTPIAMPGMYETIAANINDAGTVIGSAYATANSAPTGFVYAAGSYAPIAVPGAISLEARALNATGQIGGTFVDADGVGHAFLAIPGQ